MPSRLFRTCSWFRVTGELLTENLLTSEYRIYERELCAISLRIWKQFAGIRV